MNSQTSLQPGATEPALAPARRSRGALRTKYWASWFTLSFLLIVFAFPGEKKPLDSSYLFLYSVIALAIAMNECREMWKLKATRMPRWLGTTVILLFGIGAVSLIAIDRMGIFIWNVRYVEIPLILYMLPVATVAWIVEWRKSVDIYWQVEGLIFVPRTAGTGIRDKILAVMFCVLTAEVGFVLFHDEQLDQGFEAFYFPNCTDVPDEANAAIGVYGLSAPQGVDFMAHGRFVRDTFEEDIGWDEATKIIKAKGTLLLANNREELDCVAWPTPDKPQAQCPTPERLTEMLKENAELLERYRRLYLLPQHQPSRFRYNSQLFLDLNKLIAESIALERLKGNSESAYVAWRDNYVFLSRMARAEDSWMGKAILLAAEGISLTSAELLLHATPSLLATHGDELRQLLQPVGLSRWNLEGVMRAEYRRIDPVISGDDTQIWVHSNFIRNRHFRAANAFLNASTAHPSELERKFETVLQAHSNPIAWTWDYLRNPMNTFFVRRFSLESQLEAEPVVRSMIQKDGRMRLLSLRLLLAKNSIADGDVEHFLSKQPSELRDPFTTEPMQWDREKRVIYFCQPDRPAKCAQVRLPGGYWLDSPSKEREELRNSG